MRTLTLALGALVLSASASLAQEPSPDLVQPARHWERGYYGPPGWDGPRYGYDRPRYGYYGARRYGPPPGYGYYRGRFDCRRVWRERVTPWGEVVVRPRVVCPDGVGYF